MKNWKMYLKYKIGIFLQLEKVLTLFMFYSHVGGKAERGQLLFNVIRTCVKIPLFLWKFPFRQALYFRKKVCSE